MFNTEKELEILALIRRCKRHERSAQFELYRKFYGFGMAICIRYAHTKEDALEMLNDAFFQIFTKIHQYNEQYTFVAWSRTIFIHTAIDHLRKYNMLAIVADEQHTTSEPSVADDISKWMDGEEIVFLVSQLPPQYRAVFNLHEVVGYSHEDIAQMLGISTGTSKSNLFRAREKLEHIARDYYRKKLVKDKHP